MSISAVTDDATLRVLFWGGDAGVPAAGGGQTRTTGIADSDASIIDAATPKYTKVVAVAFVEMSQGEKDAVDLVLPGDTQIFNTGHLATSGALVVDATAGDNQYTTLTGNITSVAVINAVGAGFAQNLNLILRQAVGGYTLPLSAWTGVSWWKPAAGVPEMPPLDGETLLVQLYTNGDLPLVIGDWWNNE